MSITPAVLLFIFLGLLIVLVGVIVLRPQVTSTKAGKILAFFALFIFPVLGVSVGTEAHLERSKQTQFCLSCHTMEPYGKSLYVDNPSYLPAMHFQNARIPRDQACYTCHTDYTIYGGLRAKARGLVHVYKQYISHPSNPIKLYTPYNNRECLHCHLGARSFEQGAVHTADPEIMADIKSNKMSCLSSGCHETAHNLSQLGNVKYWSQTK